MAYLQSLLPIPAGRDFAKWAPEWISSIKDDLYSILEDDPEALRKRNERYGAYLPTITTLVGIYRIRAREARDTFYRDNPKPEKGIKEWEERRDAETAKLRYMYEWLVDIREDIMKRISVAQSNLALHREEMKAQVD